MPLKKLIFFGLVGLLLMPVTAKAQERDALTKEFTQCMQEVDLSAMKNSQWLSCYQLEYKRQDKFLNLEYQKLKAKLPPAQHNALLAGQKAWLGYRDAWCQFQGGLDVAPTPQINGVACLVDLTAEQVKKLRESF
jgi:uncharacterized protein YecT (DUF1311 family)